jgi:polyhydroxybutyrate depolymerase
VNYYGLSNFLLCIRLTLGFVLCCFEVVYAQGEDLNTSQFPEAVRYVTSRGVMQGRQGSLALNQSVTRAELAVIAARLYGADKPAALRCFSDVAPNAWYSSAVCSLAGQGLVSGYADGTFAPARDVTGAEALKVILAAFEINVGPPNDNAWFSPYVELASDLGLVDLEPSMSVTREALARFIFSLYKLRATQQRVPVSSSGCGNGGSGEPLETIQSSHISRSVITALPADFNNRNIHKLVFAFHGRTSTNRDVQKYYGLEPAPDTIFVYPSALSTRNGFSWASETTDTNIDTALFDDLLETYARTYCTDIASVFVVGHSLGASYATSLACLRGDKIRAVASLGGGISASTCVGKVAAMILHNPEDTLVPLSEGERARDTFLLQNGISTQSVPSEPSQFNCSRYGSEATLYPVVWCLQPFSTDFNGTYYPHTWPPGAGNAIMEFFASL